MNKYDDIINLERPKSKYPKMSMDKRSAIFSPFDALTGYDESISEASILKDKVIELSEEEKIDINNKLNYINDNIKNAINVSINNNDIFNYKYINIIGNIKKIDNYNKIIILDNNLKINLNDIKKIDIIK